MQLLRIATCLASVAFCVYAATLERLSLDEMTEKSTAIVRGRIIGSHSAQHGPIIYTHFTVQLLERWKGPDSPQLDVVVPGGTAGGLRQSFAGTPKLIEGSEYVLFLWTGRSGLTHVIGLSQGVFSLASDGKGGWIATREASTEAMLDPKTGQIVADESLRIRLGELRTRVDRVTSRTR